MAPKRRRFSYHSLLQPVDLVRIDVNDARAAQQLLNTLVKLFKLPKDYLLRATLMYKSKD